MLKIKAFLLLSAFYFSPSVKAAQTSSMYSNDLPSIRLPPVSYPAMALAARVMGDVVVEIVLRGDGTTDSVKALSGPPMLQQAAIEIANKTHYECERCSEPAQPLQMDYRFVLGEVRPCEGAENDYLQVVPSSNMLTISQRPFGTCDPSISIQHQKTRSIKCLWLWSCVWTSKA